MDNRDQGDLGVLLAMFQAETHQTNESKGFYDPESGEVSSFLGDVALVHSELSEACEEYRNASPLLYHVEGKPEGIAAEFADAIIRILNCSAHRGIPVIKALFEKADYNKTRPARNGGKKC